MNLDNNNNNNNNGNNNSSNEKLIIYDIRAKIFWAIRIRYAVVLMSIVMLVFALSSRIPLGLTFVLVGWLAVYNSTIYLIYLGSRRFNLFSLVIFRSITELVDVLTITSFVYMSGGLESPYWFLYLVLIVVSGFGFYSFASLSVLLIAMFSVIFYLGLLVLTYYGVLPTYGFGFSVSPHELLQLIFNRAIFITVSLFLFAATIYYFSKLLAQHRSELTQNNKVLLAAMEEMKETDRLKDEFVATASHELRTPLSVMRENISLIEDGIVSATAYKGKDLLKVARLNIDRLAGIIDSLLDVAKIDARSLALNRRDVDLVPLVDKAITTLQPQAEEKQIKVQAKLPPQVLVWVDEEQILRLLLNLIDNAIKYSDCGGKVEIGLEAGEEEIRGYVADNGIGVAEEDQKKIFERFVRLKNGKTSVVKGVGLGLSICRGIVELHGGRIWVESRPGDGSKFIFTLPKVGT
jgi:signal transduction histidine kinase